jgi:hypothetical protein
MIDVSFIFCAIFSKSAYLIDNQNPIQLTHNTPHLPNMRSFSLVLGAFLLSQSAVAAFAPTTAFARSDVSFSVSNVALEAKKGTSGFGAKDDNVPSKPAKTEGAVKRDAERSKYDELAGSGGNEYTIFVRQFGSDDKGWLPCGAIAVPRDAQVSDAIFANTASMVKSIVRVYPKLKGSEDEFEFGFNLKIYSDDPIEVAVKSTKVEGLSIGNWISTLLSPVDASKTPPPSASAGEQPK